MILVFARAGDACAQRLARELPAARLVIPRDLMRPGWSLGVGAVNAATFALDGAAYDSARVRGVVTLLPIVTAADCIALRPHDREYAAAELQAFLLAWLHRLRAPKMNPPSFRALNGDPGHPLIWRCHAAQAGLRSVEEDDTSPRVYATVVGSRVLGTSNSAVVSASRALSAAAGLPLLGVEFVADRDGLAFAGATCSPDLTAAAAALAEHFAAVAA